jgi:gliding motility-associated-like protein
MIIITRKTFFSSIFFLLFVSVFSFGQVLTISDIGGNVDIVDAKTTFCTDVNRGNPFTVTFKITNPSNITVSPVCQLQLEDQSTNPSKYLDVIISNTSYDNSTNIVTLTFNLPENTYGKAYRFVVKTTSQPSNVLLSKHFRAFYKQFNFSTFSINKNIQDIVICNSSSYTISIDDTGDGDSPLFYHNPELKYIWFKNGVEIASETGSSISVNQPGTYYVSVDYGDCSSGNQSNSVNVTTVTNSESATISNNGTNQICDGGTRILTSSITSGAPYVYKWYKDGKELLNQTSPSITVSQSGVYKLNINNGICGFDASNVVTIVTGSDQFTASLNLPEDPPIEIDVDNGQTIPIVLTVDETTINKPVIEWFRDEVPIAPTGKTFDAKDPGKYHVKVSQTQGCIGHIDLYVVLYKKGTPPPGAATVIPNLISPNNDQANDKWEIPSDYRKDSIKIQIINALGKVVFESNNYQNNWPDDSFEIPNSNPVFYFIISDGDQSLRQGSITVLK